MTMKHITRKFDDKIDDHIWSFAQNMSQRFLSITYIQYMSHGALYKGIYSKIKSFIT